MSTRYRLLHFAPDPFNGARWPLAAIVDRGGVIEVARARRLPGPQCLGDAAGLLRWMHDHLALVESFDRPPSAFGTSAVLDRVVELSDAVADPVRWLEEHVLPRPLADRRPKGQSSPRASAAGMRFFENNGVRQWVRSRFDPTRHWPGGAPLGTGALKHITHFVAGGDQLLLMEPVRPIGVRSERDLEDVVTKLQAYRGVIERGRGPVTQATTTAYLLADENVERRENARGWLRDAVGAVVDTNVVSERSAFLAHVEQVGRLGEGALPLH